MHTEISLPMSDRVEVTENRRVTKIRPPSVQLSSLGSDLSNLVHYRDLFYTLTVHRVKVRYKQSVLGIAWAVLQPLTLMLIYTVIFSYVAKIQTGDTPYALFAFSALLPWTCFATGLSNATNGLVSHAQLVTKVYFPREILPLTYVCAALFDFLVASTVLAGMMLYYGVQVTLSALYILPILLVLVIFTIATSLILSATQVRFRDVGVGLTLLLQIWMFASPVVYPLSAVPRQVRPFYDLNPMVGVVENFRRVLVQGARPDFRSLAISALISIVLLVAGYIYFKRVEATIADIV
jgi:lipopolysaccharide transport system permease protein